MPALSLRAYIDIAAGIVVLLFLGWVYHKGEQRIEAADARAVAAQVVHNAEVNQAAQSAIQAAEEHYRALYASPPVAPIHVSVCHASATIPVPRSPDRTGGSDAAADVPTAVGQVDIGPDTDHLLDQADAQIVALQAVIRAYQQQMSDAHARR